MLRGPARADLSKGTAHHAAKVNFATRHEAAGTNRQKSHAKTQRRKEKRETKFRHRDAESTKVLGSGKERSVLSYFVISRSGPYKTFVFQASFPLCLCGQYSSCLTFAALRLCVRVFFVFVFVVN